MSKKVVALVVLVAVIGGLAGFIIGMSTPSVTSQEPNPFDGLFGDEVTAGDYDDEIADELETLNSRLSTLNNRLKKVDSTLGKLNHTLQNQ